MTTISELSPLRFCFKLMPVEEIQPWGEGENCHLHWFGLTDGHYWISTPLGEALRYTDEILKQWGGGSPYVDYQVVRFFEDLQSVLPAALEPVPSDIAALISDTGWFDRAEQWIVDKEDEDERWERRKLCCEAMDWYQERALDSMHLTNGPMFHFWRTADKITVRWEATGKNAEEVWSIPNGEFAVSAEQFSSAAYAFFDQLVREMQVRVETIRTKGWNRADCRVNIPALVSEQQQRATGISELKDRRTGTDWGNVRSLLQRLPAELAKPAGLLQWRTEG
jgi:hypothetical protein